MISPEAFKLVVVQSLSRVRPFATLRPAARQASLSFTISRSLLKLTSTELVMLSNYPIATSPAIQISSSRCWWEQQYKEPQGTPQAER